MDDSQHLSINRSFSRSEPNLNVVHYRQVVITELQNPNHNGQLFRQCSYQELSSPCSGNQQPFYNHFFSPDVSMNQFNNTPMLGDSKYESMYENTLNYSPMDIDEELIDGYEEEEAELCDNTNLDRRKLHIKLSGNETTLEDDISQENYAPVLSQRSHTTTPKDSSGNVRLVTTLCCVVIAIGVSAFYYNNFNSLKDIPVSEIELDLRSSVSNQDHVIDAIIKNLNSVNSVDRFKKVLALVGNTGVGKSFILNQIRRKYSTNAYISLTYSLHKSLIQQSTNISLPDDCFLLSIDDLRLTNVETVSGFIVSINHHCVLVIPVFNLQETADMVEHIVSGVDGLKRYFKGKFPNSETVLFNSMNSGDLVNYLRKKFDERGLNIKEHDDFVSSLISHHDVENFGFKGVLPKIDLLSC